jgi:hypothetical protein
MKCRIKYNEAKQEMQIDSVRKLLMKAFAPKRV